MRLFMSGFLALAAQPLAGFCPGGREIFLLLRQKKTPKDKAHPSLAPRVYLHATCAARRKQIGLGVLSKVADPIFSARPRSLAFFPHAFKSNANRRKDTHTQFR